MNHTKFNKIDLDDFIQPIFSTIMDEFGGKKARSNGHSYRTKPMTNIVDHEDHYELTMVLAGYTKADINISIKEDHLIISSQKESVENEKSYIRREFDFTSFSRSFKLSPEADQDKINAKMENGLLQITVGKQVEKKEKTIIVE